MATPKQNYDELLKNLRQAHRFLLAPATRTELAGKSDNVRLEAAKHSANLLLAIVALENEQLTNIVAALQANEPAILAATADIDTATARLNRINDSLRAVAGVINLAVRVLPGLALL